MLGLAMRVKVFSSEPAMANMSRMSFVKTRFLMLFVLIVCLASESATAERSVKSVLLFGGETRDGDAVHISSFKFPPTQLADYHLGFSFRTCSLQGHLLNQVEGSDRLSIELINEQGYQLRVTITTSGSERSVEVGYDLDDNLWHDVDLRFLELDSNPDLHVRLDSKQWTKIGQSSDALDSSPLFKRSAGDSRPRSLLLGGNGFGGCLLEGPSLRWIGLSEGSFNAPLSNHRLAVTCPLSNPWCHMVRLLSFSRTFVALEPCWTQPCLNGGRCLVVPPEFRQYAGKDYRCKCPMRYTGDRCDSDTGSLCGRPEFRCLNGGTCIDTRSFANISAACHCPSGFSGPLCEDEVRDPPCPVNACRNGGACHMINGHIRCVCPLGFWGRRCERNLDDCMTMDRELGPCLNGGTCIDGVNSFRCLCPSGFVGERCEEKINNCLSEPCQHGGDCFDRYSGLVCQCSSGFTGEHCQTVATSLLDPVTPASNSSSCQADSCLNGGLCSSRSDDFECTCIDGFTGTRCQFIDCTVSTSTCPPGTRCTDDPLRGGRRVCSASEEPARPSVAPTDSGCGSDPCTNNGTCSYDSGWTGWCNGVDIIVPIVAVLIIILVGAVALVVARYKRATRGSYSPSRVEAVSMRQLTP